MIEEEHIRWTELCTAARQVGAAMQVDPWFVLGQLAGVFSAYGVGALEELRQAVTEAAEGFRNLGAAFASAGTGCHHCNGCGGTSRSNPHQPRHGARTARPTPSRRSVARPLRR